jgi:ribonuclease-3
MLGLVVCDELYKTCEDLLEGEMTRIKSSVVSRHTCAIIAQETGLCQSLFTGKGMSSPAGMPQSVAAAVFEAIIGAIYLDGGIDQARRFVLKHIEPQVANALDDEHKRNYKSMLQQYAQRHWNTTPEYRFLDEKGPDHNKCFEIAVVIGGKHYPSAWGTTKKEAEQEAARRALSQLGVLRDDPNDPAPSAQDQ